MEDYVLEELSKKLGIYIYNNSQHQNVSLNKTIFIIHAFLLNFTVFLTGLLISIAVHNTTSFIIFYFGFMTLRFFSGSLWHLKDSTSCFIVSSILIAIIPLINSENYSHILSYSSILIMIALSPISKISKPFTSKSALVLKIISVLIILLNLLFFESAILALAFFSQAMTLTPLTKKGLMRVWQTK